MMRQPAEGEPRSKTNYGYVVCFLFCFPFQGNPFFGWDFKGKPRGTPPLWGCALEKDTTLCTFVFVKKHRFIHRGVPFLARNPSAFWRNTINPPRPPIWTAQRTSSNFLQGLVSSEPLVGPFAPLQRAKPSSSWSKDTCLHPASPTHPTSLTSLTPLTPPTPGFPDILPTASCAQVPLKVARASAKVVGNASSLPGEKNDDKRTRAGRMAKNCGPNFPKA